MRLAMCLLSFVFQSINSSAAGEEKANVAVRQTVNLRPDAKPIAGPGVPSLTENPPDADLAGGESLSIEPAIPYRWVASPGQVIKLTVRAVPAEGTDRAVLTVWDWENRPVAQRRFDVPFAGVVEFRASGRGTYVLTLDGMCGEECRMRLVRSFSVCPSNQEKRPLWKDSGFWVGQCSFPGWHDRQMKGRPVNPPGLSADDSRELEADLVARMGVQVARINLVVRRRDPEGMDLDFSLADKCVEAYVSRGLKLNVQLFNPYGKWPGPVLDKYFNAKPGIIYPLKEEPYRHYIRETAARYAKHAVFFQIGNEPGNPHQYGGTAEEFIDQIIQAADEIRRAAPGIPITNGGYCFDNEDTQRVIEGIRGLTDFASYHWHGDLPYMKRFWAGINRLHRKAGYTGVRYANTEMGHIIPAVGDERKHAVVEMQKLLYCWAHGHIGVLLYSSRELWWPRQYSYDGLSDYGFVDYFFCPRFAYGAASAFLDYYAGFRFDRILRESDNLHAYQFRSGKRRLVAVFAVNSPETITLRTDARSAVLIDPMGNASPIADPKSITVQAGEYPQTVALEEACRVELGDATP